MNTVVESSRNEVRKLRTGYLFIRFVMLCDVCHNTIGSCSPATLVSCGLRSCSSRRRQQRHRCRASQKDAAKQIEQAYLSRLTKAEEGTITLRGQVPSESDLKILQGVAAATSPGASVIDKSRVNANVPDRDTWLAAMTFALRQLGKLQSGSAVLHNTAIIIEGVTKADDDFSAVQKKLREEAPKGLNLQVALKPHDVHPFVWIAQLQQGTLNLTGYVPDQQDQVLCAYARELFQNVKVNNGMEVAKGEPQDWLAATKLSLEMLSLLFSGNVAIIDNVIKLDGIYSSPAMVELFSAYSKRLPPGVQVGNQNY